MSIKGTRQGEFYGRTYQYCTPNDGIQVIGVAHRSGGVYHAIWVSTGGSTWRRVVSSRLPLGEDPETLQGQLDEWAAQRNLIEVI